MRLLALILLLCVCLSASGATRYVCQNGSMTSPYDTWAKAATGIVQAITGSADGDTIIVSNGTYLAPQYIVTNLTIQSVNGPAVTIISRAGDYLFEPHNGGTFIGLTWRGSTNTYGGLLLEGNSTVSNCVISGNRATADTWGGGATVYAGTSTFYSTTFDGNSTPYKGAGIKVNAGTKANFHACIFTNNAAGNYGGAIYASDANSVLVSGCLFENNSAIEGSAVDGAVSYVCLASNSIARFGYTSSQAAFARTIARNCLIFGNRSVYCGSAAECILENCTVVRNYSSDGGYATINVVAGNGNIFWGNTPFDLDGYAKLTNSCYQSKSGSPGLVNCITNYPMFAGVDLSGAASAANTGTNFVLTALTNLQLAANSPCINTGTNQAWHVGAKDYGGVNDRIINGIVDMGCYEYLSAVVAAAPYDVAPLLLRWMEQQ